MDINVRRDKNGHLLLPPNERIRLIGEVQAFFASERDESLGQLAAGQVVQFFMETLAPFVYNLGVQDTATWMRDRLDDAAALEITPK
nr:DUF2164 domain-containing protein [Maliibacterium massiliense]